MTRRDSQELDGSAKMLLYPPPTKAFSYSLKSMATMNVLVLADEMTWEQGFLCFWHDTGNGRRLIRGINTDVVFEVNEVKLPDNDRKRRTRWIKKTTANTGDDKETLTNYIVNTIGGDDPMAVQSIVDEIQEMGFHR